MRLLIIEDAKRLRTTLALGFTRLGYAVDTSGHSEEGLYLAETRDYDVILLDLTLPGMDGIDVLRKLREAGSDVHVLILTARDTVGQRVRGLRAGADDYLVKPFAFEELVARVEALVRRRYQTKSPAVTLGELEVQPAQARVTWRGETVELTRREFRVLEYLATRAGEVVSRQDLRNHVWGDQPLASNAVEAALSHLRKKLAQAGCVDWITTKRGLGYMLQEPVPS